MRARGCVCVRSVRMKVYMCVCVFVCVCVYVYVYVCVAHVCQTQTQQSGGEVRASMGSRCPGFDATQSGVSARRTSIRKRASPRVERHGGGEQTGGERYD